MNHDQHDAGEDALDGIDLHAWRVPPPAGLDRSSLLVRALSPAAAPAKRPRLGWFLAAIVLINALIATLIVIVLARPATPTSTTVLPAGGGTLDAQVRVILERLEQEQRELELKLAEIQELRARLAEKIRQYEQQDGQRDRTLPKRRDRQVPGRQPLDRQVPDRIDHQPIDPFGNPEPSDVRPCDEVSCVLTNYEGACCAKLRVSGAAPSANTLPDTLNRQSISAGIASVKARVSACGNDSAHGKVKLRVRVNPNGLVTSVVVDATPDAALGNCVAAAVQRAVFPRTQGGGSFSYPFVF